MSIIENISSIKMPHSEPIYAGYREFTRKVKQNAAHYPPDSLNNVNELLKILKARETHTKSIRKSRRTPG